MTIVKMEMKPEPTVTTTGVIENIEPAHPHAGLRDIHKGKTSAPRMVLMHGGPGVGKSTWAADSPHPIFILTEDGVRDIDCESFPVAKTFDKVDSSFKAIAAGSHTYKTVVIDSVDHLERLIWNKVCQERGATSIADIDYGKGYAAAMVHWATVVKALEYLRDKLNLNIVLIAHSQLVMVNNPEGDDYHQHAPKLHKLASALLNEVCDEVFFAATKVYTRSVDSGFNQKKGKASGGNDRIIRTRLSPFCVAKSRLKMPAEIPLEWAEYAQYFPK